MLAKVTVARYTYAMDTFTLPLPGVLGEGPVATAMRSLADQLAARCQQYRSVLGENGALRAG